jgi:ketosteroid isomerase-like protein
MPRRKTIPSSPDEIEAAYYDALSRADLEALMALWADDEEIVCLHPGGQRVVGHVAIRAGWEEILSHGALHIQPRQLHATHNMLTAVHSVVEDIAHPTNAIQEVHVVATNVYMKTAQGWKIVMHHASVCPGPAPAEQATSSILH